MGALKSDHCSKGHPLSGDNLYFRKNGTRECRQCSRDRQRAQARKKGVKPRSLPDADFEVPPRKVGAGYKQRHYVPLEDV